MTSSFGITGDIASGKSTVSRYLRKLGFTIVDADLVAREVVLPGEKGHALVKKAFPQVFMGEELDRGKLGRLIYEDDSSREKLNQLLHPLILNKMLEQAQGKTVFFDAPLLFETGLDKHCKQILYVGVSPEIQLKRLMERDEISSEEALKKMKAFDFSREKKLERSVYLDNSGTREQLYMQVDEFLYQYGLLSREKMSRKEKK